MVSCCVKWSAIRSCYCKCCWMQPQPVYITFILHFSGFCLHSLLVETGPWHLFFSIHPWGGKAKRNIYGPLILRQPAKRVPPYHPIITSLFILYTFVGVLLFCLALLPCLSMPLPLHPDTLTKDRLKLFKYVLWDLYMWWYYMLIWNGHDTICVHRQAENLHISTLIPFFLSWYPLLQEFVGVGSVEGEEDAKWR